MNRLLRPAILIVTAVFLSGCAARGPIIESKRGRAPEGAYYEVKKGDTLWKISKLYDVDVKKIVKANRLPDATKINVGQRLFIPSVEIKEDYSGSMGGAKSPGMFSWPVVGKVISYFGSEKGLVKNKGIDIAAREGSSVVASGSGTISFLDENMKGLGKTIIIDHENGFSTVYAHNSEILVKANQKVTQNQVIARVGRTGRTTEPYLHFQIRKGHEPQNPFYYLP